MSLVLRSSLVLFLIHFISALFDGRLDDAEKARLIEDATRLLSDYV